MQITFKEALTDYWPQLSLLFAIIIGGLSFIASVIKDIVLKKSDIKYSHYQVLKIEAINDFIENYHTLEKSYKEVNYMNAFRDRIPSAEYDKLFFYRWTDFTKSVNKLAFLLSEKEMKHFNSIEMNIGLVSLNFNNAQFQYNLRDTDQDISKRITEFQLVFSKCQRSNIELLKKAGQDFQKQYK